jgi:hypothetical protein
MLRIDQASYEAVANTISLEITGDVENTMAKRTT